MPSCPVCGASIGDGYNYCTECGTDLTETPPEPDQNRSGEGSEEPLRSTVWHKVIIGSTAGWVLLFIGTNSLPSPVVALVFLACWPLLPIGLYIDSKELKSQTGWPEHRWAYVLSSVIWFVAIVSGAIYLWKRHQLSSSSGESDDTDVSSADDSTQTDVNSGAEAWEQGFPSEGSSSKDSYIADRQKTDSEVKDTAAASQADNSPSEPERGTVDHGDSEEGSEADDDPVDPANASTESLSSADSADLSAFQRDILVVISGFITPSGLEVKSELEEYYDEELNHDRLSQTLATLLDLGLIDKIELDGRTNAYKLTDIGRETLQARLTWEKRVLSMHGEKESESGQQEPEPAEEDTGSSESSSESRETNEDHEVDEANETDSAEEEAQSTPQDAEQDSSSGLLNEMAEEFGVTTDTESDSRE